MLSALECVLAVLSNMVSEPGLFSFGRLRLRLKRLWFSEFVRGVAVCWLLWFLMEPGTTTPCGRVVGPVPSRWRRRFWRWLREKGGKPAGVRSWCNAIVGWDRWKWRRMRNRRTDVAQCLPRGGICGGRQGPTGGTSFGHDGAIHSSVSHPNGPIAWATADIQESGDDRSTPAQCSHLGIVNEQCLLMGGIEPNPGPPEKKFYDG